jgi:hypothetical protein
MAHPLRTFVLVAVLLAGLILTASGCSKKSRSTSGSGDTPSGGGTTPSGPAEFKVAATDFGNEVKTNPAAAEQKYVGKWVEVEGKVSFVGDYSEKEHARTLALESQDGASSMLYYDVTQAERDPGRFTIGQKIRLKVLVERRVGTVLKLKRGEVLELGPKILLKATGEELGKEFLANPKAASAKYKDKTVQLTATVDQLKQPKGFTLKSVPGVTIVCQTVFELDPLAKQVKPGDRVTVVGYILSSFDNTIEFHGLEVVPK